MSKDFVGEIWQEIGLYPNYKISNFSRVKSIGRYVRCKGGNRKVQERILVQHPNSHGYMSVSIANENGKYTYPVHLAVARAFIPNPKNLPQVAHLDHNRGNPAIANLCWETVVGNMQQSVISGRMCRGENRPSSRLTEKDVITIFETNISIRRLASMFNVSFSTIQELKSGKTWGYLTKNYEKNKRNKLPKKMGTMR